MFWKSELIKRKRAKEELDELIFNIIESLINNKKEPNEDTKYTTINKDLTLITVEN